MYHKAMLLLLLICFSFNLSFAQLMKKKETEQIDDLLERLSQKNQPQNYLIRNVNVLTMVDSSLLIGYDVLVADGEIADIGKDLNPTSASEIIDGTDKYLMPGLTDMHIHLFHHHQLKNTWILLLLVNGVTSVRDMAGEPEKLILRDKINNNEVLAPTIYQAGPRVNGKGNLFALVVATTPEEGRKQLRQQKRLGYDFIKVYNDLNRETYKAIVNEAEKEGIQVVGHVPDAIPLEEALKQQSSIEHLTGYKEWRNGVEAYLNVDTNYAQKTAQSQAWNCLTFYNLMINWNEKEKVEAFLADPNISDYLPKKLRNKWMKMLNTNTKEKMELVNQYGKSNQKLFSEIVLHLYQADAKLIAGTDAGNLPLMVPGITLHKELNSLNELGIPVYEVLKMTTINAAKAMGKENEFGTIEIGKRADLLLLNSNPLDDIQHLKDKSGLMIRGIWLSANELEEIANEIRIIFGDED